GILSTLTALLLLSLFLLLWGKERKAGIWLLALMLGMLLTVGVVGWQPILERFEHMRTDTGALADERPSYWRDSSELLRRFPLAGSGFGTFIDVYPGVKTAKTPFTVDHAHNDYLELATDGGLIGLLLVAGFLLTVLGRVVPAWRRRRSPFSIMVVLGALTGLVAIGLHSVTDFNLHIGANALFLVWLLALAVAAAHGRSRGTVVSELPRASCRSSCIAGALLAFGLLLALLFNLGVLLAQRSFLPLEQVDLATVKSLSEREDLRAAAASAARFDPLERRYRYALANVDFSLGYVSRGLTEFSQVLRLGPLQGEYLERIGSVYAHLQRPLLARRLLGAAVATDISEPRRALALAELLLARNETEEAFRIIRQALAFAPERTRDFLLLLILHRVPDEAMVLAFPERARVYEKYGDYLLERDDVEGAEAAFAQALYLFEQEENPSLQVIWRLRAYFFGRKAYQSALQVVQAGLKRQPENAALRRAAGELYERLGIPYRALEEYRHVLVIEPEDEEARERLEVLGGKNQ
ncbi:MAG: O-antigen ligase family protein, partial [Desulfuromonadaceae bacterium]